MADRIVYLVTTLKADMAGTVEFIDDRALSRLLGEGWEISTTVPDRKVKGNAKLHLATMIVLKRAEENRGLSAEPPRERGGGRGRMMTVSDTFGESSEQEMLPAVLSQLAKALAEGPQGGGGHLGNRTMRSIPGMTIVSGEQVSQAYDIGMSAGMQGRGSAACPFTRGTAPAQKWMEGWKMGASGTAVDPSAREIAEAQESGRRAADTGSAGDEAYCPYPTASPLHQHWVDAFRGNGGIVE